MKYPFQNHKSQSQSLLCSSLENHFHQIGEYLPKSQIKFNVKSVLRKQNNCENQTGCNACLLKFQQIERTIDILSSKIAEIDSKIKISFSKHAQQTNLIGNCNQIMQVIKFDLEQKKMYSIEDQKSKDKKQMLLKKNLLTINNELNELNSKFKIYQQHHQRKIQINKLQSQRIQYKFDQFVRSVQQKFVKVFEIDKLQKKKTFIEQSIQQLNKYSPIRHYKSPSFSRQISPVKYASKQDQSTRISYSRNKIK